MSHSPSLRYSSELLRDAFFPPEKLGWSDVSFTLAVGRLDDGAVKVKDSDFGIVRWFEMYPV